MTTLIEELKKRRKDRVERIKNWREEMRMFYGLERWDEELERLRTELKKEKGDHKRLKAKYEKEKEERKALELLLRKTTNVGGRPKAEISGKEVRRLNKLGWSTRKIAEEFGVSHTTICRRLNK